MPGWQRNGLSSPPRKRESGVLKHPWHKPSRSRPRAGGVPITTCDSELCSAVPYSEAQGGTTPESHCFTLRKRGAQWQIEKNRWSLDCELAATDRFLPNLRFGLGVFEE